MKKVTLTNTGDTPFYAGLSVSGREFSLRPSALTIPARGAAQFSLTFAPYKETGQQQDPYKDRPRHRAEVCVEDTVRRQRKKFAVTALAFANELQLSELGRGGVAAVSSDYSESFSSSDDGLIARRKAYVPNFNIILF